MAFTAALLTSATPSRREGTQVRWLELQAETIIHLLPLEFIQPYSLTTKKNRGPHTWRLQIEFIII